MLSAVAAHVLWGVFPLFWRQLGEYDALQVVCHRLLWAFTFLLISSPWLVRALAPAAREEFRKAVFRPRVWGIYAIAATLIGINWLTFVWAVNHGRVLESSLGYYINPLLSVLLGVWLLGERLSGPQKMAIGCAALGVGVMTVAGGGLPWVSLVLASSFAIYALVKKKSPLPALLGLLLETSTLVVPAVAFLAYVELWRGDGALQAGDLRMQILLMLGGMITIAPLALFAFAAKRVPLSAIGLLQYIAPTLQFLVGAVVLSEPFDRWRFVGFVFVWIGLGIYILHVTRQARRMDRLAGG